MICGTEKNGNKIYILIHVFIFRFMLYIKCYKEKKEQAQEKPQMQKIARSDKNTYVKIIYIYMNI